MERMHFVRKDNETCFALTEELVLHYAALIFGKENVQEKGASSGSPATPTST